MNMSKFYISYLIDKNRSNFLEILSWLSGPKCQHMRCTQDDELFKNSIFVSMLDNIWYIVGNDIILISENEYDFPCIVFKCILDMVLTVTPLLSQESREIFPKFQINCLMVIQGWCKEKTHRDSIMHLCNQFHNHLTAHTESTEYNLFCLRKTCFENYFRLSDSFANRAICVFCALTMSWEIETHTFNSCIW